MQRGAWKYVLYLLASVYLKSALALEITLAPDRTDRPTPATTLYFNTAGTFEEGDPETVVVILRDTRRGNETRIFEHNIKNQPDLGFRLDVFPPGTGYVLRLDDASTNAVAATSKPFEIFPLETPPSSTYNLQPSSSPSPSLSPSAIREPPEEEPSGSNLPLGTIIGGAVGGFAVLVLFFVLLWLLLNRRKKQGITPALPDSNTKRKPGDKDVIAPFILPTANASHPESIPMTASSNSQTRYGPHDSAASEKARLKARLAGQPKYFDSGESSGGRAETVVPERAPSVGGVSSDHLLGSSDSGRSHHRAPSSSKSAAIRAEQLRRERERIDQEIAQLEQASVYSGGAGGSRSRPSDDVRGQIAALRDQVSRMDRGNAGYAPIDEPPPEYVAKRSLPRAPH